ncbi:MAG TPA: hypothetical protein PL190_07225 [Caldisericia bacterium]|jgi:hypothetical protein|nr:MAG: hypothetical protein BWX90_01480 [bacterium ADurb.Bin132]HNY61817.1 hypothetical protein [Caldisericia bacterium]HOC79656.1 hypothetical protein [Caldisericia bacterium]HOG70948.1 hypothetical protein [Caldisericia bacterium]HPA66298.1 hypothetical protein [Caldisericia bacterium]
MSLESWIIQVITLISFGITAFYYYKQTNELIKTSRMQNFYSLYEYLEANKFNEALFMLVTEGSRKCNPYIFSLGNQIISQFQNKKIDKDMFNLALREKCRTLGHFAFREGGDLQKVWQEQFPYLYKFFDENRSDRPKTK